MNRSAGLKQFPERIGGPQVMIRTGDRRYTFHPVIPVQWLPQVRVAA